jgi:hypothetical protein
MACAHAHARYPRARADNQRFIVGVVLASGLTLACVLGVVLAVALALCIRVTAVRARGSGAALGGYTGKVYVCGTLATGFKTMAWWVNQYPAMKGQTFIVKWITVRRRPPARPPARQPAHPTIRLHCERDLACVRARRAGRSPLWSTSR